MRQTPILWEPKPDEFFLSAAESTKSKDNLSKVYIARYVRYAVLLHSVKFLDLAFPKSHIVLARSPDDRQNFVSRLAEGVKGENVMFT